MSGRSSFWDKNYTMAEAARKLGTSRQNIQQRVRRGSLRCAVDDDGSIGIPIEYVEETLRLRKRGKEGHVE